MAGRRCAYVLARWSLVLHRGCAYSRVRLEILCQRDQEGSRLTKERVEANAEGFLVHTGTGRYCHCQECSHGLRGPCLDRRCKCCTIVMTAVNGSRPAPIAVVVRGKRSTHD